MDDDDEIQSSCIFCKIGNGEIPKEFTYEDDQIMVFPDIKPTKPIHLLIVPKRHVKELVELDDMTLMSQVSSMIQRMVRQFQLGEKGYQVVINGGGHQLVDHLHVHLMGPMGKMR